MAQVDAGDGRYELFHYHDREKREIDFLIEREDDALLGIEVKAGSAVAKEDFRHMRWFQKNLKKNQTLVGIILYTADKLLETHKNNTVLKICPKNLQR